MLNELDEKNALSDRLSDAYKQLNKENSLLANEAIKADTDLFASSESEHWQDDDLSGYITKSLKVTGDIIVNIVHRMRSPLSAIRLFAELLEQDLDNDQREMTQDILASVYSLDAILSNLLSAVQPIIPRINRIDIIDIIEDSLNIASLAIKQQGINIIKGYSDERIYFWGDTEQLKQVYFNIILNTIQAIPKGGKLIINVSRSDDMEYIETEIADNGYGTPENLMDRVFTPFFTTNEYGTGLELYVTYRVIQAHKGKIKISSACGKTGVIVKLPVNLNEV